MMFIRVLAVTICVALPLIGSAQDFTPSPVQKPDEATLKDIAQRTDKLGSALDSLRRRRAVPDALLVDAEIYHKAAVWLVKQNEYFHKDSAAWTLDACDRGMLRAVLLSRGESPWLNELGHAVVRGYRSRIDGSVQPYAVTYPADYGKDRLKSHRIDIVLHGRDNNLTEVKFLHDHAGDKAAPKDQSFVQIDIYGRGNNAYRWAGEADVFEAVDHFIATERAAGGRDALLDMNKIVLRGFSMGGAGSWHLGLHHPDRFCAVGPGAGFTTTIGYAGGLKDLPKYQESCLHIYDAVDYAENAFNVPIVAYGGSEDPQLQAAKNIEAKLKPLNIPMTLIIGDKLGHTMTPEYRQMAEAEYAKHADKGRPSYPTKIHFVTYTLTYPKCSWVELLGLDEHYQKATVEAEAMENGFTIKTANVRTLKLSLPPGVNRAARIITLSDEAGKTEKLEVRPYEATNGSLHIYLDRRDGKWSSPLPERLILERLRQPRKVQGLTGPIDHAFTAPFVCVRGTGTPWHEATKKVTDDSLKRFADEWHKYFRGEVEIKDDVEVTSEDIATKHLILFGDPASNSLIEQVLPNLPLKWTKDKIALAGKEVTAAEHVPVMIYPSPLSADHYVVINSGHTFHAAEFKGTNALLFPRLGDYALLTLSNEVATAGLFDDNWRTKK
jgi:hypothetical protein